MESELSGIFGVNLVAKNIVLASPGTNFMYIRVICRPIAEISLHKKYRCRLFLLTSMKKCENILRQLFGQWPPGFFDSF